MTAEVPADQPTPPQPPHLSARVPERVRQGIFSNGVLVVPAASEFVLDFVQNLGQPAHVAARVMLPHATMAQFIHALQTNLDMYVDRYGAPSELPAPDPNQRKPTLREVYDDLKISDEILAGAYANGVMIGHAASEFKFDFLVNMMPTPAVSCRVFLSAPQVPRLLQSLKKTFADFQQRSQQPPGPSSPPNQPPGNPPAGDEPPGDTPPDDPQTT